MNNENIKDLPPIERLAEYRRQNPSPVWHNGEKILPSELAKLPKQKTPTASIAGLNPNSNADRLTAARLGHALKPVQPKQDAEEYAPRGGYVPGEGFVIYGEND